MATKPALRSVKGEEPPFNLKEFLEKLEAFAQAKPLFGARIYANGAMHLRAQAQKCTNPRDRLVLQTFALRLEELVGRMKVPLVDPHYKEEIHEWADYAGDDTGPGLTTAYDGLVADVAASKINENGEPNNELVSVHRQQQYQQARDGLISPYVQINPASAQTGVTLFGSQALIQFGGSNSSTGSFASSSGASGVVIAQDRTRIINWNGHENETRTVTVAVSPLEGSGAGATFPTGANSLGTNYSYRPYFRAIFGSSGQGQPLTVFGDVGPGTQFTLTCAFLTVDVGMDAPQPTYTPGSMLVAGQLGFFAVGRQAPVQRTIYIDSLAVGAGNKVTGKLVPAFATGLLPIQGSELNTGACQIDWKDAAGTILYSTQLLTPSSQISPIPIGNDVYSFDITNTGTITANFRLMFQLSL